MLCWLWHGRCRDVLWFFSPFSTSPPDVPRTFSNPNPRSHVPLPTLASQCRRPSPAASRSASPGAAEPPGRRWWPRRRWWPEGERSTRPPAAGWAGPPTPPRDSGRWCSLNHFVCESQITTLIIGPAQWSCKLLFEGSVQELNWSEASRPFLSYSISRSPWLSSFKLCTEGQLGL